MEIYGSLKLLDFIVIVVYLITVVSIGMWVSFRRRGADDLFLAGRSLGWGNVGLSIFGTNIGPAFLIAACGKAYTTGMVTANFEWLAWWFLLLLAMLFVPHYMNTRISTMPQFMQRRFGRKVYEFLAWYALFTTVVLWLGGSLYAGGVLLGQILNWPLWLSVLFLTVIATSFTVCGGLAAVVVTDAFQSVLMILGSAVLTVLAFQHVGGLDKLLENLPEGHMKLFRPADDPDFPWPAIILGYPILGIWFWCTDQTIVQRVLGARDIRQGQLGAVFAGFLKILPPFIFMTPGLICYVLHPGLKEDKAYMTMVTTYLPPGLIGLIVAVLIAALISTLDSGLNSFSTVFTLDIYVKKFRPQANPQEIKKLGRRVTVLVALFAADCALSMETLGKGMFDLLQGIIAYVAPPMAAVFLIGVLWRRATARAALWTLILGSITSLSIGLCYFKDWPYEGYWPHYMLMSFYLFAGISLFMIVLSLLTKNSPDEEELPTLRQTYANLEKQSGLVWVFWGILAVIMFGLYIIFN
jgi:SSS family solute:Na+ symporter